MSCSATTEIPYVTSLPEFPTTKQNIFRDFPDVFNEEYEETAKKNAQELAHIVPAHYSWMIGYFLRNEPSWAFVCNLVRQMRLCTIRRAPAAKKS